MKSRKLFQAFIPILLLSLSFPLVYGARDYTLHFNTGKYNLAENARDFVNNFKNNPLSETDAVFYCIVQFSNIPDGKQRALLAENGIVLYDYIPGMAYYASIASDANIGLLSDMNARSVSEILPEYKLDFSLFTGNYPGHALRQDQTIELFIHFFPQVDEAKLALTLKGKGISVVSGSYMPASLVVNCPLNQIDWLVSLPYIIYVEPIHAPPVKENYTGRTQHRSSNLSSDHPLGRKYDGSGVNIMLQDDGVVGPHIDYQGRIGNQYISYNWGDHGDHIAGTLVGSGNLDPNAKGMAYGATLYVYGVASGYQGFNLMSGHYNDPGIRISSTSYGDGCNAGYTSLARSMDFQVRTYPSLMHVFSAGNSGGENCGYGAGAGWGNITGGHKAAKNVIAVGNLNLIDELSGSSSRGPAHDGRIKPEVTAKGSSVYSTTNPNSYTNKSGTSMACPGVAGTLAQLYQAYRDANNNEDPKAGLMKAIIMNSADDLGNPGPDFRFGFGRINGLRAARTIEEYRHDSATIDQGQIISHTLEIPENTYELRIMLYWTDFEATAGSVVALVNDLNLVVTDPMNNIFRPWILDHTPNSTALNAPATRGIDSINNVEQVTIAAPLPGQYNIDVEGFLVPQGPQQYFITWEIIGPEIHLDYPAGGESLVPGDSELIRWTAHGTSGNFILEFSIDDGQSWELINDNINAASRHHIWLVPTAVTGQARVRLSRNGESVFSEYPFSIIGVPQNLQLDWACTNSFRIVWDEVFGAEHYIVRKLGDEYMDSIATTSLRSYVFSDAGMDASWVSVQAIGSDGAIGRRAYAIHKPHGTMNCINHDLVLESVPSAEWMVYHTCNDLTDFAVEVLVRNIGGDANEALHVGYSLDGSTPVTEPVGIMLQPDSSFAHRFVQKINISQPGKYQLKTWVYSDTDQKRTNDTLTMVIRVIDSEAIQPNPWYIETFDDFERCMAWPTCEQYSCVLESGWINLNNNEEDEIDWRTYGGSTPTAGAGPAVDHTTGTAAGNYLYLESRIMCFNREAILLSPCFDLTLAESASFSFWYHMYGLNTGRLHVDAYDGESIYYNIIPPLSGNRGDEWQQVSLPLDEFLGSKINFRFRGITGPGQLCNIALDDVEISMIVGTGNIHTNDFGISIYPNPSTGLFVLSVKDPVPGKLRISISDIMGKVVYGTAIHHSGSPVTHHIDLGNLPSGVYFLVVANNHGQMQRKLIRQ